MKKKRRGSFMTRKCRAISENDGLLLLRNRQVFHHDLALVGAKGEADAVLLVRGDVLGLEGEGISLPILGEFDVFGQADRVPVVEVDVAADADGAGRFALGLE